MCSGFSGLTGLIRAEDSRGRLNGHSEFQKVRRVEGLGL